MTDMIGAKSIEALRADFPLFAQQPDVAYLDSAATAQAPQIVLDAVMHFDAGMRANVHRGVYPMAEAATEAYEAARCTVAGFMGAQPSEIAFVPSATYGMHAVAEMLADRLQPGDGVLVSAMEHHGALLPWRRVARARGAMVTTVPLTPDYRFDRATFALLLKSGVRVVVVTAASNVLGTVNPIADIVRMAHAHGALVVVDAAQYIAHMPVDVTAWGADAVVWSGHKLYGPMGIGVLYLRHEIGGALAPAVQGGGMVVDVRRDGNVFADAPWRFEAGTPNVAGAVGLAAAVRYVDEVGYGALMERETELARELIVGLLSFGDIGIVGPDSMHDRIGIVSFCVPGVHPHDLATLLGRDGVCIRAGHHCAQPLVESIDRRGVCRASLGMYTTREDIARFVDSLARARQLLV